MNRIAAAIFLAVLIFLFPQSGSGQRRQQNNGDLNKLREEVKSLKAGQEAMQKDLQEIKKLLEARLGTVPPPTPALEAISVGDNPFLGNKNARVVLLDFSDYQCPFCGQLVRETMPQLEQEYIKTGKVECASATCRIETIHPFALQLLRPCIAQANRALTGKCTIACIKIKMHSTQVACPLMHKHSV